MKFRKSNHQNLVSRAGSCQKRISKEFSENDPSKIFFDGSRTQGREQSKNLHGAPWSLVIDLCTFFRFVLFFFLFCFVFFVLFFLFFCLFFFFLFDLHDFNFLISSRFDACKTVASYTQKHRISLRSFYFREKYLKYN